MKKLYLNLMLLVCMMSMGMNVWGAGYTRTLTENLEVPGYKVTTLYDFQHNSPEVLPTTGDLRYRDGNVWGLHNFGSGERSATVNISVTEGQLLVLQDYSATYPTTVNIGTLNESLSTTTGYRCFEITSTAEAITLTTPRYGGVVAALLMDKDASAATTSYTINYLFNGENIKTVTGDDIAVGTTISAESSLWVEGVKYIALENQTMSMQLNNNDNILNINLREAETWSYTVNTIVGEQTSVLATGSVTEGESATVGYPRYINVEGTLYSRNATNNEYRVKVTPTNDNYVLDLSYSVTDIVGVVYHSEGENIEGATATAADKTNIAIRSSNARIGYASNDIILANLPAGKYKATMVLYSNSSAGLTLKFQLGDLAFGAKVPGSSNWTTITQEFVLTSAADVKWLASGDSKNGLDFIYIQRTGDVPTSVSATVGTTGYTTFCSICPLDLTDLPAGTAYYVTASGVAEDAVTLTEATAAVPAGTGLILKGTKGETTTYEIPVAASAEALEGNLLVGVLTAETVAAEEGFVKYVLAKSGDNAVFQYIGETAADMPAGKAYIKMEESTGGPGAMTEGEAPTVNPAKMLNIYLPGEGEATAIKTVAPAEQQDGAIYNLAGQRVGKDYKGVVIMNGKKYLVK